MITPAHAQAFARYNRWQNRSLYTAAAGLADADRKRERGAFFGSLHGTLSHLYFTDMLWLHRFTGTTPVPKVKSIAESATAMPDWNELAKSRRKLDADIIAWADALAPADLAGDFTWASMTTGTTLTRPRWLMITHWFNHQTHHRGQAHCLLTQSGMKPEDTDLPFMPADET